VSGADRLTIARAEHCGFLRAEDVAVIAADPRTRLTLLLVRCGNCRFLAPADQVKHLIDIITREGTDHVRDVSLPATGGAR
jgi:hypothetical protein